MIKSQTAWEELKDSLRIGTKVRSKVLRHGPFGIFVSLPGIPFDGLVQITDFKDTGRMTPNERLKLTGAAILVFRASTSLQAAPAA
jgi:ribosomal protein S1